MLMKIWRKFNHWLWLIFAVIGAIMFYLSNANNNPYPMDSDDPVVKENYLHWQVNAERWNTLAFNVFTAALLAIMIQKFVLPRIKLQANLMRGLGMNEEGVMEIQPQNNPHFGKALVATTLFYVAIAVLFGFVMSKGV